MADKTLIATIAYDTLVPAVGSPSYVGGQTASFAGKTTATTVTFALTGGLASVPAIGDLVMVSYAVGSTADRALTISNSAGGTAYTLIDSELYQDDTYDSNLRVAYRFMPDPAETTLSLSGTGAVEDAGAYVIHVFRGVDSSTPLDVAAVSAGGINTRLANPGSITPTTAGAWVYVVGAAAGATTAVFTNTGPGLTGFLAKAQADTVDVTVAAGYSAWTSGAYDCAAFTGGGTDTTDDSWTAMTVALRPASPTPFASARQTAIDHIVSAQSEGTGWNAVRSGIPVTALVRTSDTVMTLTIPSLSTYDITAQEVITWTIPAEILVGGVDIVASPTWTIDPAGGSPYSLVVGAGSFGMTGTATGLKATRLLTTTAGSYAMTGTAVALKRASKIAAERGVFDLTGTVAALKATRLLSSAAGSFAWTGQDAALLRGYSLISEAGGFSLTGDDAGLLATRKLVAGAGTYSFAGQDVTLIYTPVGAYILTADGGVFALDGTQVGLLRASKLSAGEGSFLWSGADVSLSYLSGDVEDSFIPCFRRRRR